MEWIDITPIILLLVQHNYYYAIVNICIFFVIRWKIKLRMLQSLPCEYERGRGGERGERIEEDISQICTYSACETGNTRSRTNIDTVIDLMKIES